MKAENLQLSGLAARVCRSCSDGRQHHYVFLEMADLGSSNLENLAMARSQLHAIAVRAAGKKVIIEVRARRVGAAFAGILAAVWTIIKSRNGCLEVHCDHARSEEVLAACGCGSLLVGRH